MAKSIDLYRYTGSLPCQAVLMTAKMLKINLNLIEVDITQDDHMKPEFLKLNPHHTVPTIVDNGFILWESRAIMTYLVEMYARKDTLYPKNPALRAKVNQSLYYDCELYKLLEATYAEPVFSGTPANVETIQQAGEKLNVLEQALAAHKYAAGDQLTVADIALATSISAADAFGHDFSGNPQIADWFARCKSEIAGYEEINQHGLDRLKVILENAQKVGAN